MQLESAQIRNFRILKHLDIDLEDALTLVIGKNNSGKTSFMVILQKFLAGKKPEFTFEDFSIETQQEIISLENTNKNVEEFNEVALSLKLIITYKSKDNIGAAAKLLLDLDGSKNHLVVLFEFVLTYEKYSRLMMDFADYESKIDRDFEYYLTHNLNKYFILRIKALEYENEDNFKVIKIEDIQSIISLQVIGAKRDVDNEEGKSKALSILAGKYYTSSVLSDADFPELQQKLSETDTSLSGLYQKLFDPILKEISELSYNPKEAELSILSTLSEKKIFQDNTTVKYKHGKTLLPEDYNGLGYLNLFAIVFTIRIKLDELSKENKEDENPTPLNLLFIEEPEAHTHPQMQYIFIKNIKTILDKQKVAFGKNASLQTILSTHSSHIVSQCDFEDIKYFYRENANSIKSRNLKLLNSKMVNAADSDISIKENQERAYRFVKQYVTLNRAELFFADKAVLIEGDTERILFSAMMKKADDKYIDEFDEKMDVAVKSKNEETIKILNSGKKEPLLSQNISVVEVGAYSHIFATFLGFLGIKTLIVTDIDCAKPGEKGPLIKCQCKDGTSTTNASIKYFTGKSTLADIIELAKSPILLSYDDTSSKWCLNSDGQLRVIFQKEEKDYQARSFEDAFICNNLQFVISNKDNFTSLKNLKTLETSVNDFYKIADECIDSKTAFALDVLLYGGEKNEKWNTPLYIMEGLEWLVQ